MFKTTKVVQNQLVELNVNVELAQSEALHDRVAALVIDIPEKNAKMITLETQAEEVWCKPGWLTL